MNGIQEVSGSIPLISTKGYAKRLVFVRKQAFSLFCDEIGISVLVRVSPKGSVPCERPLFLCPNIEQQREAGPGDGDVCEQA